MLESTKNIQYKNVRFNRSKLEKSLSIAQKHPSRNVGRPTVKSIYVNNSAITINNGGKLILSFNALSF